MTVAAYYNEHDKHAAAWLRNLAARNLIAPGDVDERSITEVQPDDIRGYSQCHFFAGIGGWSYALRLAGWPDDRPVWTGSCPCQPFSAAGAQRGSDDERHLWPAFFRLISECGPASVFGEQVAGAAGLAWLDHVCADLEGAGYAAAAADLPACSVGAPHRRQRLFWVANAGQEQRGRWARECGPGGEDQAERNEEAVHDQRCCAAGTLADANGRHASAERQQRGGQQRQQPQDGRAGDMADLAPRGQRIDGGASRSAGHLPFGDAACELDDAEREGLEGHGADQAAGGWNGVPRPVTEAGALDAWRDLEWIECSDGKARPTQPGLFPLAHGVPGRVGRLRAYGNAIVPALAAAFVTACMEPA